MPPFERSLCVLCDRDVTGKKRSETVFTTILPLLLVFQSSNLFSFSQFDLEGR